MRRICATIITLCSLLSVFAIDVNDNVISPLYESTYIIHEKDGNISDVKCNTAATFLATRHDDRVIDLIFYGDVLKIDKVSAPGVKPIYRAYEGDEMFYTGSKVCIIDLPLEKGKEKKVSSERTYTRPEHFCDIPVSVRHYTLEYITKIIVPKKIANKINVRLINATDSMCLDRQVAKDGSVTYILKQTNMKPYKSEPLAPPFAFCNPSILVTGYFDDLQSMYDYFRTFCCDEDPDSATVTDLANNITTHCANDFDRIDSIANWVRQNIRYLAIEHGDYAMKPDLPSQVIKKRFGDCKCSANLIKAMLRAVGIDGRLVWIGTNDEILTEWDEVPALCSGNHMIAAAVLPDTTIFIDGTSGFSPAGFISPMISSRKALMENGDSYQLVSIPEAGVTESILHGSFKIVNDDLVGEMTNVLKGVFKMSFAKHYYSSDYKKRENLFRRWLIYPKKNVECDSGKIVMQSPSDKEIILSAHVTDRGAARKIGDIIYVDLLPIRDFVLEPVPLSDRKYGVSNPFTYVLKTKFELAIPDGYAIREFPEKESFDSDWFNGYIEYRNNG
ncbi:MAG: transglutaminase-like domain-containing protein, partial [Muribaculaceae bacterium]|nr:transglutaminase-like domain-containing protein [Muribaculaceae bacterium]